MIHQIISSALQLQIEEILDNNFDQQRLQTIL
jgi:hypothetical protein